MNSLNIIEKDLRDRAKRKLNKSITDHLDKISIFKTVRYQMKKISEFIPEDKFDNIRDMRLDQFIGHFREYLFNSHFENQLNTEKTLFLADIEGLRDLIKAERDKDKNQTSDFDNQYDMLCRIQRLESDLERVSFRLKTDLPKRIRNKKQAKKFLKKLIKNGEEFHPEDRPENIIWERGILNKEQQIQLRNLMDDIWKIKKFDPCGFIVKHSKK